MTDSDDDLLDELNNYTSPPGEVVGKIVGKFAPAPPAPAEAESVSDRLRGQSRMVEGILGVEISLQRKAADTIDRLTEENEKLTRQLFDSEGNTLHWQQHYDRLKDEIAGYPSVADLRMAMVLAADENANQKLQIEKFKDQYEQAVTINEAAHREIERLTAGNAELNRRYRKSLNLLQRSARCLHRMGWEEGETTQELTDVIAGFLGDQKLEDEIFSKNETEKTQ